LERLVKYTEDCVREQLRMEMNVAPLSSRSEMAHLLDGWIGDQIGPRVANARRLAQESSQRKAKALAERVLQALKSSMNSAGDCDARCDREELKKAEIQLREAASRIEDTSEECFRVTTQIREAAEPASATLIDKAVMSF